MTLAFVAKRRFDPTAGERWTRYVAWSGLSQLRELVSLDEMLCPTVPETLIEADWNYNVHADYQTSYFSSLQYLQQRVAGKADLNILAILQNPSHAELDSTDLADFSFVGFDLLNVCGDVSALTNCGGFAEVFANAELSELGLLRNLERAYEIQGRLRAEYPGEPHAQCHVWAIWRLAKFAEATA